MPPGGPGLLAVPLPRTRMRRQWSASPGPGCPSLSPPLSREPAGLEAEVPATSLGLRPPSSARESSVPPRFPARRPASRDSARCAGPRSRSAPPSPMPPAAAALATASPAWAGRARRSPPRAPPARFLFLRPRPRPDAPPLRSDWTRVRVLRVPAALQGSAQESWGRGRWPGFPTPSLPRLRVAQRETGKTVKYALYPFPKFINQFPPAPHPQSTLSPHSSHPHGRAVLLAPRRSAGSVNEVRKEGDPGETQQRGLAWLGRSAEIGVLETGEGAGAASGCHPLCAHPRTPCPSGRA